MSLAPDCLGCGLPLNRTLVDLGLSPLANSNLLPTDDPAKEALYPLHVRVCDHCLLAQVDRVVPREAIFHTDYAYFSSYSQSWLAHCANYATKMVERFHLDRSSQVIEIASNDGYLLQYFLERGIPVLGVEPSGNTAAVAIARGIPTEMEFFGQDTASALVARGHTADLLAAKNVMAHVPDINDFVAGVRIILAPNGVFTVEFPHLQRMIEGVQFDTIYHEHFTYLSLLAVEKIFDRHGLRVFDVEQLSTHGGSLRVYACATSADHAQTASVTRIRGEEITAGFADASGYDGFDARVRKVRSGLLAFFDSAEAGGLTIGAYGAAAKGNTLLNYCGINRRQLPFIADLSGAKQGRLAPGSHIPIVAPEELTRTKPDYILILPWNLRDEIKEQLGEVRSWGGRFVTAIPDVVID